MKVPLGGDHLADACSDQRVATRAGAAVVRTRLQRDVGGDIRDRVALRLRITQRHDFGVWAASALGVAPAQQLAVAVGDDAADAGVGGGEVEVCEARLRARERSVHIA